MAAVLRKTIGAGKQMRKQNSAIASKAKAKATQNVEVIRPAVIQLTQQPTKLLLKIAHRMYDYVDGQDTGNFTSFTTRGHIIVFPVQLTRRFKYSEFTSTLVDFCRHNWPGGMFTGNWEQVFKYGVSDWSDWDTGFKIWTGHLQDDDDIGIHLRRLPKWPLDRSDKIEDLSVEEILACASWTDQDDEASIGKGKARAQSNNSYNLTLVYEWLYEPPKGSPELGTYQEKSDSEDWGLNILYEEPETITPITITKTTTPITTTVAVGSHSSLTTGSTTTHKRGISDATPRAEREEEEVVVVESRSRAGRLRKPSSKATGQ
jgi:hypothetical protein